MQGENLKKSKKRKRHKPYTLEEVWTAVVNRDAMTLRPKLTAIFGTVAGFVAMGTGLFNREYMLATGGWLAAWKSLEVMAKAGRDWLEDDEDPEDPCGGDSGILPPAIT